MYRRLEKSSFNNEKILIFYYLLALFYTLVSWLDNHALTLKQNSEKYYFGEKSGFFHLKLILK
jgi:hypothetical protein